MIQRMSSFFRDQPIQLLLIVIPFAILSRASGQSDVLTFLLSAIAIIPLASLIGDATEALSFHTGPRIGGLLNATLGNAAELIITIVAIREGLLDLVKASITGSILGNILLVMGAAFLLGGFKNGIQVFNHRNMGRYSILLILAVIALVIPSVLSSSIGPTTSVKVETLSLGVAVIMILLYAAGLIFGFQADDGPLSPAGIAGASDKKKEKVGPKSAEPEPSGQQAWTVRTALIVLGISTVGVAYMSELLVATVEPVVASMGVSEFFLGVILIPIIGNVAEHLVAVKAALKNEMDLSVEIAIASSLQVALFVAPLLVFISLLLGNPLQLIFNEFELLALIVGVIIAAFVAQDGESNWLEGAELLAVYVILALAFFLLPV